MTNASGAAVNIKDRLPAGTYTVTVSREGYETQSKEVKLEDKDAKVVEINLEKMIEVDKVEALNLAEIKVTFTKALTTNQVTEAKKAATYSVYKDGATSTSDIDTVTVADDNKSATILLKAAGKFENGKSANKVVVSKAIGLAKDYTNANIESKDIAVPQIVSVVSVGNKMVKVTFSEAVKLSNGTDGKIATPGNYFSVTNKADTQATPTDLLSTASISADKRTVTITLNGAQPVGTYKLETKSNAIEDFADYAVQQGTKEFEIAASTTIAQAQSIKVVDRKTVSVTFDGAVSTEGTPSLTWKAGNVTKTTSKVTLNGTDTLEFTFDEAIATGKVDFTVKDVKDAYNYKVAERTFTGVEVEASSLATATVKVINDDKIEVIFNQKMQNNTSTDSSVAGDAANKANYTLTNAKGETIDLSGVTVKYTEEKTTSTYKTTLSQDGWNLTAGTYTLVVKDVKDTYGDVMATVTDANVVIKDTTRPTVSSAIYSSDASAHKIAITFSEAMATTGTYSLKNASAYQIDYSGAGSFEELPSNATLSTSTDGKTVFIEFPVVAGKTVSTSTDVKVGIVGSTGLFTVADEAGNILSDGTASEGTTKAVHLVEDDEPTLAGTAKTVYVKDATTLYVKTGVAFASVDASDFEYTVDGINWKAAKSASLENAKLGGAAAESQYLVLGLNDTLNAKTTRANVNVRIAKKKAADYKSKTALGTTLKSQTTTKIGTIGGVDAEQNAIRADLSAWPFRAQIVSAEVLNSTTVRVEFDGLVDTSDYAGLAKFLEIVNGTTVFTGATELNGTGDTMKQDGDNAVIITITPGDKTFSLSNATTVRTKIYNSDLGASSTWVTDANKTYYKENTTGVVATNKTDLKIVDAKLVGTHTAGILDANTDMLTVTFNQALKASSVGTSTTTGTLDTTGTLKIDGVGTISGFEKPATNQTISSLVVNLTSDGSTSAENAVTVKFASNTVLKGTGTLTFTPASTITDNFGKNVAVETKTVVGELNAAPSVVKMAAKAVALPAGKSTTVIFSEALSTDGKEKVEASLSAEGLEFTWSSDGKTLTIKNIKETGAVTLGTGEPTNVTDLAGGNATSLTLVDTAAPGVSTKIQAAGSISSTATLVFTEELSEASKTAVKTMVEGKVSKTGNATFIVTWTDATTLTITATPGGGAVNLATLDEITVTDIAGNSATLAASDTQN